MGITKRPLNEGFMPKGMKKLNEVFTLKSADSWPAAKGIWGMGPNDQGQMNSNIMDGALPRHGWSILPNVATVKSLAAANNDSSYLYTGGMAVMADGTLWAWGFNFGQYLGLPLSTQNYKPTQIGTDTNWEQVFNVGQASWLALKNGGELWACGQAANGRLFTGNTTPNLSTWTRVQSSFTFKKVAAGFSGAGAFTHAMALRSDNTLWTVGTNAGGKTGLNTTSGSTTVPTQVGTATDWFDVSCSGQSTSAIKTNGTLWTCGSSLYSVSNGLSVLTQLGTDTDWTNVIGGADYTMFHLKSNGRAYRSGQNTVSGYGAGSTTLSGSLQTFDDTKAWTWKWISTGGSYVVGVRTDGKLFYSGSATASPFPTTPPQGNVPSQQFYLLEEMGSIPTTAVTNAGTYSFLVSY